MQGCDFWFCGGVFDEPVALVLEGEHEVLVQLAPILEENPLIILIISLKDQLLLHRTEKQEF